tara:strand:+ start:1754 stop:2572 length:819 start_codon:yes stop_codon:yes gene_type:complete
LSGLNASAQEPLRVVASIKPLQLLAAAITDGVSSPALVIGAGQDPHHPALRPSERRTLAQAGMTLWVGPPLEAALADVIDTEAENVITAYTLLENSGLTFTERVDPHVWLSTGNARLLAQVLARRLQRFDSANRVAYANNLNRFLLALDTLDQEIAAQFAGLDTDNFAVYHNAFAYFEKQFGLQHQVSFTENEEIQPGVRRILQIQEIIAANEISCLLIEPGNNPVQLAQLLDRPLQMTSIDVLGFAYPLSATAYVDFMRNLSVSIAECIGQ